MDTYKCERCKEEWEFFSEDYDSPAQYPTRCPLCSMSVWEMIKHTYQEGGIREVIYQLKARYL